MSEQKQQCVIHYGMETLYNALRCWPHDNDNIIIHEYSMNIIIYLWVCEEHVGA